MASNKIAAGLEKTCNNKIKMPYPNFLDGQ
jgi:hypothetical protein